MPSRLPHNDLWNELEQIFRQVTGHQGTLAPDMGLTRDLQLDSMALLSLTVEIENRYQVTLGDGREIPETLGEVRDLLAQALSAQVRV